MESFAVVLALGSRQSALPLRLSRARSTPKPSMNIALLEGQGDLVTRLITGIIVVTIWVIGVFNLLTKSP